MEKYQALYNESLLPVNPLSDKSSCFRDCQTQRRTYFIGMTIAIWFGLLQKDSMPELRFSPFSNHFFVGFCLNQYLKCIPHLSSGTDAGKRRQKPWVNPGPVEFHVIKKIAPKDSFGQTSATGRPPQKCVDKRTFLAFTAVLALPV